MRRIEFKNKSGPQPRAALKNVFPGKGVDQIDIRDEQRNVGVEHLRLDDDELPFLVHVHIAEKVRDDIR